MSSNLLPTPPTENPPEEPEVVAVAAPAAAPRPSRGILLTWLAAMIALTGFVLFGRVPIEAGWFPGLRSDRVVAVWADLGDRLSGSTTATRLGEVALYLGLVLFLVGSAVGLWFALTARSVEPAGAADDGPDG